MSDYLEIADAAGRTLVTVPIDRDVTKIGKLTSSHVRLEGETVSRMHAVLERTANGATIIDLGSSAGTLVNGAKISKVSLQDGDVIEIGESHLRYRTSSSPISSRSFDQATDAARERDRRDSDRTCPYCPGELEHLTLGFVRYDVAP